MNNKIWKSKGIVKQIGGERIVEEGQPPRVQGGEEVTFYPLPVGMLMRIKNTCKEAAPFLTMCFTDTSHDADTETLNSVKGEGNEVYPVTNVVVKAVSPSTATFRFQQKQKGIEALIDTLFSDGTRDLLADMVIASAPEAFSEDDKDTLLNKVPAPVFLELLGGVFEANGGAFASLGEYLPRLLQSNPTLADGVAKVKEAMAARP